ncbi:hypothetical protein L1987_06835 [Smallanthus sonchifolius]|uniref:Uncharacterized protein n=1 Tax=Smallanthus sonchifolius TaxID=185202 RepID=A0ACB9JZC4_9ASTR|nr:hypothetical protein L1987_06835 [Smallanthus sonchifolius]
MVTSSRFSTFLFSRVLVRSNELSDCSAIEGDVEPEKLAGQEDGVDAIRKILQLCSIHSKTSREELPRVSTSTTKGSTPSNLVIEAADEDEIKFDSGPDESSVIVIQAAVRKFLRELVRHKKVVKLLYEGIWFVVVMLEVCDAFKPFLRCKLLCEPVMLTCLMKKLLFEKR